MKNTSMYVGIALCIGLFAGYLIFGGSTPEETSEADKNTVETAGQKWTCSMHPQVMQPEKGDCPICGMDLVVAGTVTDGLNKEEFRMTKNAIALANIHTSIVGAESHSHQELKLSGMIKESEEAHTVQVTHFSGRIEKLLVNSVGDKVKKGQAIAMIYSPELVAAQQELLTATALKKTQPKLYNAVRNKLKLWKISENQISQIEVSGVIKENVPIYAATSGIVSVKMVESGDYVKQGQTLFKISNLSSVWASFDAYENQISLLKKGQKLNIKTNVYPNQDFEAVISFIAPVLDTASRTVVVRAVLKNDKGIFKPGMFIEGVIASIGKASDARITVPKSAVLWTGKRSVVYVKTKADQPIFAMRAVTIGVTRGDSYEILDGLNKGEEIVTNGTFTVDATAQLQGKKSMMKRKDFSLPETFQQEFVKTLATYFSLKDALVANDAIQATLFGKQMLEELKTIDTADLQSIELKYLHSVIKMLEAIIQKNDLKSQRDHFVKLNEDLSTLSKSLNNLSDIIYIQQCPMANSNQGAMWLSKEQEVRNPYFGDAMLTCGSVTDVLREK